MYNLPLIPFCVFFISNIVICISRSFMCIYFYIFYFFFHLAYSIISLASWMSSVQLHNYFNVSVYYFCHLCHLGSISPLFFSLLWHSALWTLTIFISPNFQLRLISKVCHAPLGRLPPHTHCAWPWKLSGESKLK